MLRLMDTRGKKQKREQLLLRLALAGAIVQSPPVVSTSVRAADLESGEGSSESVTSDTGSAKAAADDVLHIAHALCKVCAKSPKAVVEFVRRVSPATVGRSIDWDVIRDDDARKLRKGVIVFRNDPLKHIDLHHAIFGAHMVVGNHSDVTGAAQGAPQGAVQWQTIYVMQLTGTYRPPALSAAPPPSAHRDKGKRPATESSASGGSSKKSRSDSTGQALERIAALRMESMESRTKEATVAKATGVEACLQLAKNDGHRIGGPVWYAACRLFHDPHHCFCFVRLPDVATWLEYISTGGKGADSSSGATQ